MLPRFHVEMMSRALAERCSARALKAMIRANIRQDWPRGQVGHPEYHFDDNAFEKSYAYIEEQRARTVAALRMDGAPSAWAAFGCLTHTAQDFYSHSNYVHLWLARLPAGARPTPEKVEPVDPEVLGSSALRSGRVYLLELFSYIPGLKGPVMSRLPRDAHGWMNLDSPEKGPEFDYAFHAAHKRTVIEFEKTTRDLPADLLERFLDGRI